MLANRVIAALIAVVSFAAPLCAVPVAASPETDGEMRKYTLDDMLKIEGVGAAVFKPGGERTVFEVLEAYDPDGETYAPPFMRSRIYVSDARRNKSRARLLFPQKAGRGYFIDKFSPSGRRLAFYTIESGVKRAGVYDFKTRKVQMLEDELPLLGRDVIAPFTPIWLSDEDVLYRVKVERDLEDPLQSAEGFEAQAGMRAQATAREKTWRNEGASVTVLGAGRYQDREKALPQNRLVKINLRTGARKVLGQEAYYAGKLSPSGRYLAVVARRGLLPVDPEVELFNSFSSIELEHEAFIAVYDLVEERRTIVCAQCQPALEVFNWSPADDELLVFFSPTGRTKSEGRYYRYNPDNERLAPISMGVQFEALEQRLWLQDVKSVRLEAGWIGRSVVFRQNATDDESRLDWVAVAPDGARTNLTRDFDNPPTKLVARSSEAGYFLDDGELWRISLAGVAENVTAGFTPRIDDRFLGVTVAERTRSVFFSSVNDAKTVIFELETETGSQYVSLNETQDGVEPVISLPERADLLTMSASEGVVYAEYEKDGRGVIRKTKASGESVVLHAINRHMKGVSSGKPVLLSYEGDSGKTLRSWLLLPPDAKPGERHPLIVIVYPGTVVPDSWWSRSMFDKLYEPHMMMSPELYAAQGYAVLRPDMPLAIPVADPMIDMWPPVEAAIREVVRLGYVDEDRMAVRGHSGGGYAVASLITQTDAFKAGVWGAGISNLSSSYGEKVIYSRLEPDVLRGFWAAYWENQGRMGGPPWADPDRYVRNSPVFHANDINTPLMMIHGDMDEVGIGQAEEMFSALARQNKDVVLLTYWGEQHGIISPHNIRDLWARKLNFLEDHLGPVN